MIIDRVLDGVRHRVLRIRIELADRADDPAKAVDVDPVALEAVEKVHGGLGIECRKKQATSPQLRAR